MAEVQPHVRPAQVTRIPQRSISLTHRRSRSTSSFPPTRLRTKRQSTWSRSDLLPTRSITYITTIPRAPQAAKITTPTVATTSALLRAVIDKIILSPVRRVPARRIICRGHTQSTTPYITITRCPRWETCPKVCTQEASSTCITTWRQRRPRPRVKPLKKLP